MLHLLPNRALLAGLPCLPQGSKAQEGFKLKGATEHGRMEAPKAARWGHRKHSSHKVRCAVSCIWPENLMPMLNEDARSHWLGRDNVGYATIEGKWMPVLLDMGANVNMITSECMVALGLQMGPLTDLCEGDITIDQPFNYKGRPIGWPAVLPSLRTMFPLYWELLPLIGPLRLLRRVK